MKEINQDKDKITEKNKNEEKISLKKSSKSLANLHLNDLDDFFIPIKKLNKEKEKEQIERLTKNLSPKNKGKLTMNKAIGWIFLAAFLTVILNCIAKIFGLTKRDVDQSKSNPNFNKTDFYSLVLKRTIIYFIINM